MRPYRVQALVAEISQRDRQTGETATDGGYTGPMWYDASADCYARPHPEGLLAGDGTEPVEADPESYDRQANREFPADLGARVDHRLPDCGLDVQRAWAGLCTATPDRDPLLGELETDVFVATGLCGHGLMRSPALGRIIAEQMLGDAPISGFDPNRFDGGESVSLPLGVTD